MFELGRVKTAFLTAQFIYEKCETFAFQSTPVLVCFPNCTGIRTVRMNERKSGGMLYYSRVVLVLFVFLFVDIVSTCQFIFHYGQAQFTIVFLGENVLGKDGVSCATYTNVSLEL